MGIEHLAQLHWAWQAFIVMMVFVGGAFAIVGGIGLVRFADFFMRLHARTKASTLGVGGVSAAPLSPFSLTDSSAVVSCWPALTKNKCSVVRSACSSRWLSSSRGIGRSSGATCSRMRPAP